MDTKPPINNPETISYSNFLTSFGWVYIAKSTKGLCQILFPDNTKETFQHPFSCLNLTKIGRHYSSVKIQRNDSLLKSEVELLKEYFNGKQVCFNFALDLRLGTEFQRKVWRKLQEIPYGEYRSYKWVAEQIGHPLAARAVGMANNKNPLPPVIPCHRVIGSNGSLTGYAFGISIKKRLLEMECYTAHGRHFSQN